jgi:hypothetical protein
VALPPIGYASINVGLQGGLTVYTTDTKPAANGGGGGSGASLSFGNTPGGSGGAGLVRIELF